MTFKIKGHSWLFFVFVMTACSPNNHSHTEQKLTPHEALPSVVNSSKKAFTDAEVDAQDPVYVMALQAASNTGDAAAAHGVLNVQNGCLYIDDMLLIVTSPIVHWEQQPFVIENDRAERLVLGDRVLVGGSSMTYQHMIAAKIPWTYPPKPSCQAQRVWLMNSIEALRD